MNAREEVLRLIYGDKYDTFSTESSDYSQNVIVTAEELLVPSTTSYQLEKLSGEMKSMVGIPCFMIVDPFEIYVSFEDQQVIEYFRTLGAWGSEATSESFVEFDELKKRYYQGIEKKVTNLEEKVDGMTDSCLMDMVQGDFGTEYLHEGKYYVDYTGEVNNVRGMLYMIPVIQSKGKEAKLRKEATGIILAFQEALVTHTVELKKEDDLNVAYESLRVELKSNGTLRDYSERSARVLRKKIK